MKRLRASFLIIAMTGFALAADEHKLSLDPEAKESKLELFVKKKGALKALAHDHRIGATAWKGTIAWVASDPERSSVELEVDATKLAVLDPWLDDKDREKVRKTMLSDDVLDAEKFPAIRFTSQRVSAGKDEGKGLPLQVTGKLELHGVARQVRVDVVVKEDGAALVATGAHRLKQTDFGIEPYSTGFGTIAVEDEIALEFTIVAREKAQPSPSPAGASPRSSK